MEVGTTFLFRLYSLQSLAIAAAQILLLALRLTFVVVAGHIDLSIAFSFGFAAVTMALVVNMFGADGGVLALLAGLAAGIFAGLSVGVVNDWLVSRLDVPSFIGTLGTYGIARGAALIVAGGAVVSIQNEAARTFGNVLGVPIPVLLAVVLALVCHYTLTYTRFGVHTYTLGASCAPVVRVSIDVKRHLMILFVLSSVTAAIGGLVYTGRLSACADPALRSRRDLHRWRVPHRRPGHDHRHRGRLAHHRRDPVRSRLLRPAPLLVVHRGWLRNHRRGHRRPVPRPPDRSPIVSALLEIEGLR